MGIDVVVIFTYVVISLCGAYLAFMAGFMAFVLGHITIFPDDNNNDVVMRIIHGVPALLVSGMCLCLTYGVLSGKIVMAFIAQGIR